MRSVQSNGARLFYEVSGVDGAEAIVLVHGSWVDRRQWDLVTPELGKTFRVAVYDRRGHGESEAPPGPGRMDDDVSDLAAVIEGLGLAPAHVAGSSFGGTIALKLAASRPEILRSVSVHEPPLLALLALDPSARDLLAGVRRRAGRALGLLHAGDSAAAAKEFVDAIALGPGAWDGLPDEVRDAFQRNAKTWGDEMQDPDGHDIDLVGLGDLRTPVLLTRGTASPPVFTRIAGILAASMPKARRHIFEGAGHIPHVTHPREFVEVVTTFARSFAA